MQPHLRYARIVVESFAQGPVLEEIHRELMGPAAPGLAETAPFENRVLALIDTVAGQQTGQILLNRLQGLHQRHGIRILPAQLFPPSQEGEVQDAIWAGRAPDAHASTSRIPDSDRRGTGLSRE